MLLLQLKYQCSKMFEQKHKMKRTLHHGQLYLLYQSHLEDFSQVQQLFVQNTASEN